VSQITLPERTAKPPLWLREFERTIAPPFNSREGFVAVAIVSRAVILC
jgi:hypothetical protein